MFKMALKEVTDKKLEEQLEEEEAIAELRDRFTTLQVFEDGGERIRDNVNGMVIDICPYCKVGDCFRESIDAQNCPSDYKTCSKYSSLQQNRTGELK
ncbi:hypothetical protein J4402_02445 [Candidatus Pacearchaeota archaeon]|nr:hypothetical protein [Candidatus Pacearchaeota archaeon]